MWLWRNNKGLPEEVPDNKAGRAATRIACEFAHCGYKQVSLGNILQVIEAGVALGILEVKNDGIEPD